jgi:phospholipid transport system substrate-binding protein
MLGLLAAGAMALPAMVGSREAAADARIFIDALGDKALEALTGDIGQDVREQRFRELLNEFFDMRSIGKFVLARYWKVATDEEKDEFLGLFETLVVQAYAQRFTEYSGERFNVIEVTADAKPGYSTVRSVVERPEGEDVRVDWLVLEENGVSKIEDVKIEGVSMAQTYRSEFASVIQSKGGKVAGLITALRDKTGAIGQQSAAQ